MIEVGGIPVLVHIMRHYYAHGFNDFVICGGYRAIEIKKYFMYYQVLHNDLDIDHRDTFDESWKFREQSRVQERWRVRVLDTGLNTQTGGRIARALKAIGATSKFDHFAVTYGDGLSDVNLTDEFAFHRAHSGLGTVLGVKNTARYGELDVNPNGVVKSFVEKPVSSQGFINGGFFFFRRAFENLLHCDESLVLENQPLTRIAADGDLHVFRHLGFWHAMDTLRDRMTLERLWDSGQAPWSQAFSAVEQHHHAHVLEPRA